MDKLKGIFLTLLLFAGGLLMLFFSYQQIRESVETGSWPSANGTVIQSGIRKDFDKGRSVYYPEVKYRYTVDNREYSGSRVAVFEYGSGILADSEAVAGRYPAGSEVKVSYNPEDPSSAVLEPGVQISMWWLLPIAGLVLALLGLVGTLTNIKNLFSK